MTTLEYQIVNHVLEYKELRQILDDIDGDLGGRLITRYNKLRSLLTRELKSNPHLAHLMRW